MIHHRDTEDTEKAKNRILNRKIAKAAKNGLSHRSYLRLRGEFPSLQPRHFPLFST